MEKIKLAAVMFIVGSIGLFVHYIPLPPAVIACSRAVIGTLFLLLVLRLKKTPLHGQAIRKNALCLLLSGAALGFNWIFLFEAFRHTGIAVATLCYYMAPVFVILLSPLVLGERLTRRKIVCTLLAVLGAVCISGVFTGSRQDPRGIAFGLAAALLYCSLILLNKRLRGLDTLETTFCQLCTAALVMLPYVLLGGHLHGLAPEPTTLLLLLVVGIVHTGLVYILFFSAVGRLPAQTTAVLSYVDPVTAILLATLFLHQPFGPAELCGTVLILGATLANELPGNKADGARS